jgi:ABC-type nitrate/sulfonate/bicarbonate transport system permease component
MDGFGIRAGDWPMLGRRSGLLLIAILLLFWEMTSRTGLVTSENWPPVSAILAGLVHETLYGDLVQVIGATLSRFALGYVIGICAGAIVGFTFALVPFVRRMFEPIIELLRPIPAPALIPPLVLFLGVDDLMKVTIIAVTAFFPVAINTMQGASGVEPSARAGRDSCQRNDRRCFRGRLLPRSHAVCSPLGGYVRCYFRDRRARLCLERGFPRRREAIDLLVRAGAMIPLFKTGWMKYDRQRL